MRKIATVLIVSSITLVSCEVFKRVFKPNDYVRKDEAKKPLATAGDTAQAVLIKAITDKMKPISFVKNLPTVNIGGYQVDDNLKNAAPFLVGQLVDIDLADPDHPKLKLLTENYLMAEDKLSTKLLSDAPDFDSYIQKGATTNVKAVVPVSADLNADESLRVSYRTLFSAVPTGSFLDKTRLEKDAKDYNYRARYKNLAVIYSVTVKRFIYNKFTKFSGAITGSTTIVNLNGNMYYRNGDEINADEVYITVADLPLTAQDRIQVSDIDEARLNKIIEIPNSRIITEKAKR